MENSRPAVPNYWRLTVICGCALLAIGLVLLVGSPTQASQAPVFVQQTGISSGTILGSTPVITIGVGAVLSGPDATLGWPEANAVQLAISQTNAAGGINVGGVTYTLALVIADDGCNASQGATAATSLLNAGAIAVVGYSCSSASRAAEPIHNAAGVSMISPSSTNPDVTQQGYSTTFRVITHDGTPPTMLATHFRRWLGISKSAVVQGPGSPWGNQITDIYSNTFTALGGTITSRRLVTTTGDFISALTAIQAENPGVIFYSDNDPSREGLLSLTAYALGMPNVAMGWSTWGSSEADLATYASAAGSAAAEGDYAAMEGRRTQDMPGYPAFLAAYQAAGFANSPTDTVGYSPYAYDAARIIIAAIVRAGSTNPTAIRNAIATTQNFQGVVGTYQGFDSHGDVIPQLAWLERYQNGQWVLLKPTQIFLPLILR